MLIFQTSSLLKSFFGFFFFQNDNQLLLGNYWLVIATISATLIGISLTTYNIHRSRAEQAAADPICRKYSFVEDSFSYSWRLVILAVIIFAIASSLSLYVLAASNLGNKIRPVESWFLTTGRWFLILWAFHSCISLCAYIIKFFVCGIKSVYRKFTKIKTETSEKYNQSIFFKFIRHVKKFEIIHLIKKVKRLISWKLLARLWKSIKQSWELIKQLGRLIIFPIITVGYLLLIWGAFYFLYYSSDLFLSLLKEVNSHRGIKDFEYDAQVTVIISLIIGILIMYSEYYLFQPHNIIFKVEDSTKQNLNNTINDINDKCESSKHISEWLNLKVKDAKKKVKENPLKFQEDNFTELQDVNSDEITSEYRSCITEQLLSRAEESIKGYHKDPMDDNNTSIELTMKSDYHIESLKQFLKKGYATYEEIISVINGIELYLEGLNKHEARLKELPAQIELLTKEFIAKESN
jgi:hypothetical protein